MISNITIIIELTDHKFFGSSSSSGNDFTTNSFTVKIPANTTSFALPDRFVVVDDNVNEIEEAFTLIGELDVPEEFACFQTQKDEPGCIGGRMGAIKVLIDDNDR